MTDVLKKGGLSIEMVYGRGLKNGLSMLEVFTKSRFHCTGVCVYNITPVICH